MSVKNPFFFPICLLLLLVLVPAGCDSGSSGDSSSGSGTVTTVVADTSDSVDLNGYLTAAINDEYRARDTYENVMARIGQVRPFVNIKRAEEQHINLLVNLFNTYGLPVPGDSVGGFAAPATLAESCALGVEAEIANVELYVGLLSGTTNYPDVQSVFLELQSVSQNKHLPAFQGCAN